MWHAPSVAGGQPPCWEQVLGVSEGVWHGTQTAGFPLHLVQGHGGWAAGQLPVSGRVQCFVCIVLVVAWIGVLVWIKHAREG